ncbi:helix-turn-helix domain-containing protein [Siphonobacter sp.]|uniref:helix-turn-helix domain-containing protein n=1 Tax=Siphonobacter sp. TaxID=1869184 RepID=UPI003B3A3DFA
MNAPIKTSCYHCRTSNSEHVLKDYVFVYQIQGAIQMYDAKETLLFGEGSFYLGVKNKVARFVKIPPEKGEYRAISLTFSEQLLQEFSREYGYVSSRRVDTAPLLVLPDHPLYHNFIASLQAYSFLADTTDETLVKLKLKEALLVLLKIQPELKDILFDFAEPYKIDLASFMEQNFRFNLPLTTFAYLTGRSISAFKRDFEKLYHCPPAKWLQEKRLDAAYFLLKEKKQKPTQVYEAVGFKDFSHFSFVFKKHFGLNPSSV